MREWVKEFFVQIAERKIGKAGKNWKSQRRAKHKRRAPKMEIKGKRGFLNPLR